MEPTIQSAKTAVLAAATNAPAPPLKLENASNVQILVYNVSHVDVIVGVNRDLQQENLQNMTSMEDVASTQILARPRFNRFYPLTLQIEDALLALGDDASIIDCEHDPNQEELDRRRSSGLTRTPSGEHLTGTMSPAQTNAAVAAGAALVHAREECNGHRHMSLHSAASTHSLLSMTGSGVILPVGFNFSQLAVEEDSWGSLSVKTNDAGGLDLSQAPAVCAKPPQVCSIMLPLVSQLLFTWLGIVEGEDADTTLGPDEETHKIVILVSGCGTPRNRALPIESNSTKAAARIIKLFIERTCPSVEVTCLDSGLDIFHYDQNVRFCNDVLLPAVNQIRNPLVSRFGNQWQKRLGMTVALTDGSPARLAALNASLRQYRPNYLHMWQLKSFWYELKFLGSDLIFQTFETMETKPPVPIADLEPDCRLAVEEMRKYKQEFIEAKRAGKLRDMEDFWLRKSRKVVLSVLMVQAPGDSEPRFYRGMNLEVSLPTGSLCAERNVIGTALASNQTLRRQDFRYITVLSVALDNVPTQTNAPSSLRENHSAADIEFQTARTLTPDHMRADIGSSIRAVPSQLSIASTTPEHSPLLRPVSAQIPRSKTTMSTLTVPSSPSSLATQGKVDTSIGSKPPSPRRNYRRPRSQSSSLSVYSGNGNNSRFAGERNPIEPCGACNEWLKKIAEVNPTFKVVTFPNSDCQEAFVHDIEN